MKKDKSEVHYSLGTMAEHCGNCRNFLPHDDACQRVNGHIVARMWCELWQPRNKSKAA